MSKKRSSPGSIFCLPQTPSAGHSTNDITFSISSLRLPATPSYKQSAKIESENHAKPKEENQRDKVISQKEDLSTSIHVLKDRHKYSERKEQNSPKINISVGLIEVGEHYPFNTLSRKADLKDNDDDDGDDGDDKDDDDGDDGDDKDDDMTSQFEKVRTRDKKGLDRRVSLVPLAMDKKFSNTCEIVADPLLQQSKDKWIVIRNFECTETQDGVKTKSGVYCCNIKQ